MKKSILAVLLLLAGLFSLFAQKTGSQTFPALTQLDTFLISESLLLTKEMSDLAGSQEFLQLMSTNPEIDAFFNQIADGKYSKPAEVYFIFSDKEQTDSFITTAVTGSGFKKISPVVKERLLRQLPVQMFVYSLNGREGAAFLAAVTMLTAEKSYVKPADWQDSLSVLLVYEGAYSSLTSFRQSGDGVISASSIFLRNSNNLSILIETEKDEFEDFFGKKFFTVVQKQ